MVWRYDSAVARRGSVRLMPDEIKQIIKKYGDYIDFFERGSQEEIEKVNAYMGRKIRELQEMTVIS